MPNLERQAVTGWFAELRSDVHATWPPAIRPIEATEQAHDLLVALGAALDELCPADLRRLRNALRDDRLMTEMRTAMAQLGAARTLRLLHWLAEVDLPDCHDVIAALTQGQDAGARALRATIEAVTRAAMVRRMFAPDRIAALELACETVKENLE
jgi:hypothetical protein